MTGGAHDDGFHSPDDVRVADLAALCARSLDPARVPGAARIIREIPIYDAPAVRSRLNRDRWSVMAEWAWVLRDGSGVLVLKGACTDFATLDAATTIYDRIIAEEKAGQGGKGDHFAKAGANDRIWNSLQKLCLADPQVFARYFANPVIDAVCEAWLGPGYQMTAQVNLVRPGGRAQDTHRDYHLGFASDAEAARFPSHVHDLSPLLTLQVALAHCDMPVESGPTKLLPFLQLYPPGYLAYRRPEIRTYFEANFVQLPLEKGDAVFFNPALFHGAGDNVSADIARMANLLQVSSAMGRAMESVDRLAMSKALYPALLAADLTEAERDAAIAACAEGYAFPTNLDTDPPLGGMAPETQAALMRRALREGMSVEAFIAALDAQDLRRRA